jgi:hypothetical protein
VLKLSYCIGDTDGCADKLKNGLHTIGATNEKHAWTGGKNRLVLLGDHFGDRKLGDPESLALLMELRDKVRAAGGEFVRIEGNHEASLHAGLCPDLKTARGQYFFNPESWCFRVTYNPGVLTWPSIAGNGPIPAAPKSSEEFMTHKAKLAEALVRLRDHHPEKLVFLSDTKLAHRVQTTQGSWIYFTHTPVSADMANCMATKGLDSINSTYQTALNASLVGSPLDPNALANYSSLKTTFLHAANRGFLVKEDLAQSGLAEFGPIHRFICGHEEMNGYEGNLNGALYNSLNRKTGILRPDGSLVT